MGHTGWKRQPEEPGGYFQVVKLRCGRKERMQRGNSLQRSPITGFPASPAAIGCCSVKEMDFETSSLVFPHLGSVCVSPGGVCHSKKLSQISGSLPGGDFPCPGQSLGFWGQNKGFLQLSRCLTCRRKPAALLAVAADGEKLGGCQSRCPRVEPRGTPQCLLFLL